jgi:hypothetical protein
MAQECSVFVPGGCFAQLVIRRLLGANGTAPGAGWLTVTVLPPTVSVALREDVDVFAVALTVTVPLPDPLAPAVTDSHDAFSDAVHVQPVPAVTVTVPVPPPATILSVADDTVMLHATPAWVTVTV